MDLLEFGTYLSNGIVALALGVALLCYRTSEKVTRDYNRARRYLAYCNVIGAATDAIAITMIADGYATVLLKEFIVPAVFYVQMALVAFSLLALMRSKKASFRNSVLFSMPIAVIVLAYITTLFSDPQFRMTFESYTAFCDSRQAHFLSVCLYVALFAEIALSLYWVTNETIKFCKRANDALAGDENIKARRIARLTLMLWCYFIIAIINSFPLPTTVKIVMMWLSTAVFVASVIMVINFSSSFVIIEKEIAAEENADRKSENKNSKKVYKPEQTTNQPTMDTLIENWKRNAQKQYLKEGITLSMVARKIGVSPRLLSEYLNNVKGMNFNTWINSMRIDEVKEIIKESPDIAMVEIAQRAGFTDSSAMTKVFKRFVGMTPTQYRSEIAENNDTVPTMK